MDALVKLQVRTYVEHFGNILKENLNASNLGSEVRPLSILLFFFFSMLFFFTNRRRCMLWHVLLFGGAFGPAYAIFWCFRIQLCSFWGGSNFKKCFQQAITLLYGRFRRSQQCCVQRMCVQQYVCVYAKYTLCVHTAVRPRNIPRNIMHYSCFMCNILYQYHVSYASDLACIKHNRVVKGTGRAFMRFVAHLLLLCLLCCALCLFFAEHCLFSDMLFHMLFIPK